MRHEHETQRQSHTRVRGGPSVRVCGCRRCCSRTSCCLSASPAWILACRMPCSCGERQQPPVGSAYRLCTRTEAWAWTAWGSRRRSGRCAIAQRGQAGMGDDERPATAATRHTVVESASVRTRALVKCCTSSSNACTGCARTGRTMHRTIMTQTQPMPGTQTNPRRDSRALHYVEATATEGRKAGRLW